MIYDNRDNLELDLSIAAEFALLFPSVLSGFGIRSE
jgi:hypothetical protein